MATVDVSTLGLKTSLSAGAASSTVHTLDLLSVSTSPETVAPDLRLDVPTAHEWAVAAAQYTHKVFERATGLQLDLFNGDHYRALSNAIHFEALACESRNTHDGSLPLGRIVIPGSNLPVLPAQPCPWIQSSGDPRFDPSCCAWIIPVSLKTGIMAQDIGLALVRHALLDHADMLAVPEPVRIRIINGVTGRVLKEPATEIAFQHDTLMELKTLHFDLEAEIAIRVLTDLTSRMNSEIRRANIFHRGGVDSAIADSAFKTELRLKGIERHAQMTGSPLLTTALERFDPNSPDRGDNAWQWYR